MNWNAPRYVPPPPIALGSPPDSHSLVLRAQRLLRWLVVLPDPGVLRAGPLGVVAAATAATGADAAAAGAGVRVATPAIIAITAITTAQRAKRSGRGAGRSRVLGIRFLPVRA